MKENNLRIGPHISIAKGFKKATEEAVKINANTYQFFTRNPRGGRAKNLDFDDIEEAIKLMELHKIDSLLAHAPYTMNLASKSEETVIFSKFIFTDDLARLEKLPSTLYNFHPGSHVGQGVEIGIAKITEALNEILTGEETTTILLETMSGKGTEIGSSFDEIKRIIDGVEHKELLGVCLDTCHVYSAGYDIVNHLDDVIDEFDRVIGLNYLKAIHLNDSMKPFGSNKDRHEKIGDGTIGLDTITNIITHPLLKDIPFFLETPNEMDGYQREIELLRGIRNI